MKLTNYRADCIHFTGYKPCAEHKITKSDCTACTAYAPANFRILIIKTGAAGDVIRTTPILHRLQKVYPQSEITWITHYPEFIPTQAVNRVMKFTWDNCMKLMGQKFNLVINLDKSLPEANLLEMVEYEELWGFKADKMGKILPANQNAYNKWVTGVNDQEMRKNKKHFVEELFEVCGWKFEEERYWIHEPQKTEYNLRRSGQKVIGLNTGCGERWLTRLWPTGHFEDLCTLLKRRGYKVVLLGGPDEDEKNKLIAKNTGSQYLGVKPLLEFVDLVSQCDVVVTTVTMALHVAIALEKRTVLFNNIFPTNEFYMYGLGQILEPKLSCQSCFKNAFDSKCQQFDCLSLISPETVLAQIESELAIS